MAGRVHIGTSGWHYQHWKGVFYPEGMKNADQLTFYAKQFDTVELNNSFYRLPAENTFRQWREATPDTFLFSVKAHRRITHFRKLSSVTDYTAEFVQRASLLQQKLGPILFQLPPKWKSNPAVLSDFAGSLPAGHRYVFEFRDPSWYNDTVYDILRRHDCAFCIYELAGHLSPVEATASFTYVRLHGPGDKYQGSYPDETLTTWASHCQSWRNAGLDVFIYFDNDQHAYAADNAKRLSALIP
ncbi:DUF72 domain-containing protein [Parapedobacter deserti]|uniref:DUF72 domain-containing protein n=1 Tax=Parapedobacter deserti TaxID=1912957 RepID=A0ABV7JQF6_9SPHI